MERILVSLDSHIYIFIKAFRQTSYIYIYIYIYIYLCGGRGVWTVPHPPPHFFPRVAGTPPHFYLFHVFYARSLDFLFILKIFYLFLMLSFFFYLFIVFLSFWLLLCDRLFVVCFFLFRRGPLMHRGILCLGIGPFFVLVFFFCVPFVRRYSRLEEQFLLLDCLVKNVMPWKSIKLRGDFLMRRG